MTPSTYKLKYIVPEASFMLNSYYALIILNMKYFIKTHSDALYKSH